MSLVSFKRAYLVKQRYAASMLKKRGIHGVGVGYKDPAKPHKGAALIVYADKAVTTAAPRTKSGSPVRRKPPLLPSAVKKQVPVRIVGTGKFRKNDLDRSGGRFRRRIRPVIAGYSVGTPEGSGTAGLIVSDKGRPQSRYILSNNHVLVNENSSRYSPTLQPGAADNGTVSKDQVGVMTRYIKLHKHKPNYLDAAISTPLRRRLLAPKYAVFGTVPGYVTTYKIGDRLKKVGRTSGVVSGRVESIHTDIQVDYGDYGNLGTITFKNQSVIRGARPVSLTGDSGSVWLTQSGNRAAAVNFAGSDEGKLSIAYPIDWFMKVFGTRVARSGRSALSTPARGKRKSYMCVRPLHSRLRKKLTPCHCHSRH